VIGLERLLVLLVVFYETATGFDCLGCTAIMALAALGRIAIHGRLETSPIRSVVANGFMAALRVASSTAAGLLLAWRYVTQWDHFPLWAFAGVFGAISRIC